MRGINGSDDNKCSEHATTTNGSFANAKTTVETDDDATIWTTAFLELHANTTNGHEPTRDEHHKHAVTKLPTDAGQTK